MTPILRRAAALAVALSTLALAGVLAAAPAAADTPEGWAPEPTVGFWHWVVILGAFPLLAFVVVTLLVSAPALARGESLKPGPSTVDDQWLGGPRTSIDELTAPDSDTSRAGGASGRW